MRRSISFRFKGGRDYVHGTDMVEAAMHEALQAQALKRVLNLVFVINRMTDRNLDLVLDEQDGAVAPVTTMTFEAGGKRHSGVLVERPERPVQAAPYDERALRSLCRVDPAARALVLGAPSPLRPLETLVAMTKALHEEVYREAPKRWVFTRLEAPCWPLPAVGEGCRVALTASVGTRLTKASARMPGMDLAMIYFSLKERP